MEAKEEGLSEQTNTTWDDDINIVRSPAAVNKNVKSPEISFPDLIFRVVDENYDLIKDKVWVCDVIRGTSYNFSDIKPMTRKIASALSRLGFKKGDVLFFVTYDAALIYMVHIGVWLCGGAMRGCYQEEHKDVYVEQMREVTSRFVLCDPDTSISVTLAAKELGRDVQVLSIGGQVQGALSLEELINSEDCSAFPKDLKINPQEDVMVIVSTSGSTGTPKGVMHTHCSRIFNFMSIGLPKKLDSVSGSSMLSVSNNFVVLGYGNAMTCLLHGISCYNISKFNQKSLMASIQKYKPDAVFMYPYVMNGFLQSDEINNHDLSFMKCIISAGSVISFTTVKTLEAKLPHVKLSLRYGMSETQALTKFDANEPVLIKNSELEGKVAGVKYKTIHKDTHISCGHLLPLIEAKIVDPNSGCSVGRNVRGNLLVKTPYFMKGYVASGENKMTDVLDKNGWFHTGDVAFFDESDYLYVVDRSRFTFKYYMHWVAPAEVETIILKHPDVLSAVVVGIPDPFTTSVAKAFVVLKPGSQVSGQEIQLFVTERTEDYKHIHGGVVFVDSLPITSGGKVDRHALLKQDMEEMV